MAITALPAAAREKEVNEQMGCLDKSVANLNQTVERLAPSLSKVLSDAINEEDGSEKPIKSLCALANEIRNVRYKVDAMEEGIRDILKRLEV